MLKAGRDFSIFKQLIRPCFWVCSMLSQKEFCAVYCFYVFRFHFVLLTANFLLFMNTDGEGQMSEMSLLWINLRSSPVYIYCGITTNKPVVCAWVHDCGEKTVFSLALRSQLWPPFSFSLFCSVEKPPHAHRDQLFHRESLLRWRAGHHHLPAG